MEAVGVDTGLGEDHDARRMTATSWTVDLEPAGGDFLADVVGEMKDSLLDPGWSEVLEERDRTA